MAAVTLRHVSKVFDGGVQAVKDVSLSIENHEFLVLLGPSGCGKTTLLRLIAGLELPTAGEIWIGDRLVNHVPPKDRNVAMVFQNYALYPHMSIRRNITLSLQLRHAPRQTITDRLSSTSSLLGIDQLLKRYPKQLSGGQQQRVALGRTIIREPQVFLMDEPLSNLDARLRVRTRTELVKLHRRLEATIIYVTHDQSEAMTMATRVAVMDGGVVQQLGSPLDIYQHPLTKFVASFIGNPEMNFLSARIVNHSNNVFMVGQGFEIPVQPERWETIRDRVGQDVWLGIRPEKIQLAASGSRQGVISGTVDVVEPLGGEVLVYLLVDGETVVAQLPSDASPSAGDRVGLAFPTENIHAFERSGAGRALW